MQLLTPTGYRDLADLAIGDRVCAWEIGTGLPIVNTIEQIETITPEYFAYVEEGKRAWVQSYDTIDTWGRDRNAPWAASGKWYKLGALNDLGTPKLYEWAVLDPQTVTPTFTFYVINGMHRLFAHQSVWANGNVTHARDLKIGDILFDDADAEFAITSIVAEEGAEWVRFSISGDSSYIADGLTLHNASRYWVAATGYWSDTAHWSASSGGAGGASVPTSADDAAFNAASSAAAYTMTLDAPGSVMNLTMGAPASGSASFVGSGGNNINVYGNLDIPSLPAAWSINRIYMTAVSGTKTVRTSGTVLFGFSIIANAAATIQLLDKLTTGSASSAAFDYVSGIFAPNGQTVELVSTGSTGISGAVTFYNLTRTGAANTSGALLINANIIVTNLFTATGAAANQRVSIQSATFGTARTITAAAVAHGNVNYMDIAGAGAGWAVATTTGTIGDCQGNSGITFTPGAPQYFYAPTAGTKLWSDATKWFLGSGGTGGAGRVPLPQDNVVIDANSIGAASTVISHDMPQSGKDVNWTGVTNTPTWSVSSVAPYIFGSLTTVSAMVWSNGNSFVLSGRGSHTINLGGLTVTGGGTLYINGYGGTYTAVAAITLLGYFNLYWGTFADGGYSLTAAGVNSSNSNTRALNATGAWTITGSGSTWNFTSTTGLTLTSAPSTIKLTDATATAKVFAGGGKPYNGIWLSGAGSGEYQTTGNNTFSEIKVSDGPKAIKPVAGTTITAASWTGFEDNAATINTASGTGQCTLAKSGGGVASMRGANVTNCIASPANTFYAGSAGVDGGNNVGWLWQDIAVLSGAAAAAAAASGALDSGIALAGVALSVAGAGGTLTTAIPLAAAAVAVSAADGVLNAQITLSGAALAEAAAAAGLDTGIPLDGLASGAAAASGTLTVQIVLSGDAAAAAGAGGELTAQVQLSAVAIAQAVASGSLTTEIPLAAFAQAQASVVADFVTRPRIHGYRLETSHARTTHLISRDVRIEQ